MYDRSEDPRDTFCSTYTGLICSAFTKDQVDLEDTLDHCFRCSAEEADYNFLGFSHQMYPTREDMIEAYRDSMLKDYKERNDWLNEFLVNYFLGSFKEGANVWLFIDYINIILQLLFNFK